MFSSYCVTKVSTSGDPSTKRSHCACLHEAEKGLVNKSHESRDITACEITEYYGHLKIVVKMLSTKKGHSLHNASVKETAKLPDVPLSCDTLCKACAGAAGETSAKH